ncbi:MAG: hypothetical protein V3U56_12130 [Syntrophobacteria bacterium]
MFKVIEKRDRYVFFGTKHKLAIMPNGTFKRGRKRMAKRAKIRKPVHAVIDGRKYKFTRNEWKKALEHGVEYEADPRYVRRFLFGDEIAQKVKLSPKLADQRALRLKNQADAAAEIILASGQD